MKKFLRRLTSISDNISGRMCFKTNSLQGSTLVLGNKDALDLPAISGRGIWLVGSTQVEVQAPYIEDYETVELDATTYTGDLIIDATNVWLFGEGSDQTIIDGDLIISGNRNEIRGIRVTGRVRISGNLNKIIQSDLSNTTVFDTGNDNEY